MLDYAVESANRWLHICQLDRTERIVISLLNRHRQFSRRGLLTLSQGRLFLVRVRLGAREILKRLWERTWPSFGPVPENLFKNAYREFKRLVASNQRFDQSARNPEPHRGMDYSIKLVVCNQNVGKLVPGVKRKSASHSCNHWHVPGSANSNPGSCSLAPNRTRNTTAIGRPRSA